MMHLSAEQGGLCVQEQESPEVVSALMRSSVSTGVGELRADVAERDVR